MKVKSQIYIGEGMNHFYKSVNFFCYSSSVVHLLPSIDQVYICFTVVLYFITVFLVNPSLKTHLSYV